MPSIRRPVHGIYFGEMSLQGLFCFHHGTFDGLLLALGNLCDCSMLALDREDIAPRWIGDGDEALYGGGLVLTRSISQVILLPLYSVLKVLGFTTGLLNAGLHGLGRYPFAIV